MSRSLRILILAGDADNNFGDQAIEDSTCRGFLAIDPSIQITVVSRKPKRVTRQYDGRVSVVKKGLLHEWRLIPIALKSDMVLIGGGGLLQDDDSLIKVPYWTIRILLMRLCCRRIIGYSLGVGPLRRSFSRGLVKIALWCMSQISVRDPIAQSVSASLTKKPVSVVPDPALGFSSVSSAGKYQNKLDQLKSADEQIIVGVAPRRWFPPGNRLIPGRYRALFRPPEFEDSADLVQCLIETLQRLIKSRDAIVLLLPSYASAVEGDHYICEWIHDALPENKSFLLALNDCHEYRAVCEKLDVLVGGRMHPIILAASAGVPVVGLSYNQKFEGLFQLLDRQDGLINVQSFVKENRVAQLLSYIDESIDGITPVQTEMQSLAVRFQEFNRQLVESYRSDS